MTKGLAFLYSKYMKQLTFHSEFSKAVTKGVPQKMFLQDLIMKIKSNFLKTENMGETV